MPILMKIPRLRTRGLHPLRAAPTPRSPWFPNSTPAPRVQQTDLRSLAEFRLKLNLSLRLANRPHPAPKTSIPIYPDTQIPPSHPPLGFVKHLADPLTGSPQMKQSETHSVAETSSERGRNSPRVTRPKAAESRSTACFSHFPGFLPESQEGLGAGTVTQPKLPATSLQSPPSSSPQEMLQDPRRAGKVV